MGHSWSVRSGQGQKWPWTHDQHLVSGPGVTRSLVCTEFICGGVSESLLWWDHSALHFGDMSRLDGVTLGPPGTTHRPRLLILAL